MGRNRELRKRIRSCEQQILEHQAKVSEEESKETPDYGRIHCWEREIQKHQDQIARAMRRLGKEW